MSQSRRTFIAGGAGVIAAAVLSGCGQIPNPIDGLPSISVPNPFQTTAHVSGRLVFVRGTSIVERSSGSSRVLASGQSFADPAWSPDGSLLAATLGGTNHSDIVLLDRSGRLVRQLTNDRSNVSVQTSVWARKPAWAPDGKRIVFVSDREKHDMSLWLIPANGGQPEPLVLEKKYSTGVDWPTWTPDGTRIAYAAFDNGPPEIREVDLKSRLERVLVSERAGVLDPAWSPDGKLLAYVGRDNGADDLYVFDVTSGRKDRLTNGRTYRGPVWSPTGTTLAAIRLDGDRFVIDACSLELGDAVRISAIATVADATNVVAQSGASWSA